MGNIELRVAEDNLVRVVINLDRRLESKAGRRSLNVGISDTFNIKVKMLPYQARVEFSLPLRSEQEFNNTLEAVLKYMQRWQVFDSVPKLPEPFFG